MRSATVVRLPRSSSRPARPPSAFFENRAGGARAWRLCLVYEGALGVLYLLFLGLTVDSAGGVKSNSAALALFSLVALLLGAVGFWRTVARAPRGASRRGDDLLVTNRFGRVSKFRIDDGFRLEVIERHREGIFGPEPTELVRLFTSDGTSRTYLVGRSFLPDPA